MIKCRKQCFLHQDILRHSFYYFSPHFGVAVVVEWLGMRRAAVICQPLALVVCFSHNNCERRQKTVQEEAAGSNEPLAA